MEKYNNNKSNHDKWVNNFQTVDRLMYEYVKWTQGQGDENSWINREAPRKTHICIFTFYV